MEIVFIFNSIKSYEQTLSSLKIFFGYDSLNPLTMYPETFLFTFFSQWKKMSDKAEMKVEEVIIIS